MISIRYSLNEFSDFIIFDNKLQSVIYLMMTAPVYKFF